MDDISVGMVVLSKCGRDKNRYFVIYKKLDNGYVLLVDGDLRKLSNPKLKKIKHIARTNDILQNIAEKFIENKKVFDKELYSALRPYNDKIKR